MRFVPLDGAVKHIAHHRAGEKKDEPSFLQEMLPGLSVVSTGIGLVLPWQEGDAPACGTTTPVRAAFPLVKKEESETECESPLRCCS